jgi:hypothetical protein
MNLRTSSAVVIVLLVISGTLCANPIPISGPIRLTPENPLVITFTTNPEAWGSSIPDSLEFSLGADGYFSPEAYRGIIVDSLYAGDTFLGSWSFSDTFPVTEFIGWDLGAKWKSQTSPAPQLWPEVDFTSLLSGDVQGRIVLSILSGSVTFDASQYGASLYLICNRPDGSGYGIPSWLTIEEVTAASVPEPSTLTLMGIPIVGLIYFGLKRRI